MSCGCCIEIETPQHLKDSSTTTPPYDVFSDAYTKTGATWTYALSMKSWLWAAYRYRMLGNCNVDYWVQCFADRWLLIGGDYDDKIKAVVTNTLTGITDATYSKTTARTAITGTDGDKTISETEDMPDTVVGTGRYLSSRRTDTYKPNTQDAESFSTQSDLTVAQVARILREYPHIEQMFVDEFRDLFLGRW